MNRWIKELKKVLVAIAALGFLALVWLFLTQVIAIAFAVLIGFIVTVSSEWKSGLLAGIIAYALVMKVAWYLEIYDMIGFPAKKRTKPDRQNPPSS